MCLRSRSISPPKQNAQRSTLCAADSKAVDAAASKLTSDQLEQLRQTMPFRKLVGTYAPTDRHPINLSNCGILLQVPRITLQCSAAFTFALADTLMFVCVLTFAVQHHPRCVAICVVVAECEPNASVQKKLLLDDKFLRAQVPGYVADLRTREVMFRCALECVRVIVSGKNRCLVSPAGLSCSLLFAFRLGVSSCWSMYSMLHSS